MTIRGCSFFGTRQRTIQENEPKGKRFGNPARFARGEFRQIGNIARFGSLKKASLKGIAIKKVSILSAAASKMSVVQ